MFGDQFGGPRRRVCCSELAHDAETHPELEGGARHGAVVFHPPNAVSIMRPVFDRRFLGIRLCSVRELQRMSRREGGDGLGGRPFALESLLLAAMT